MAGQYLGEIVAWRQAAHSGPVTSGRMLPPTIARVDTAFGGAGYIAGTAKVDGVIAANKRIWLLARRGGFIVRSAVSDENGEFRFDNLDTEMDFLVIGLDDTATYNAVPADYINAGVDP